MKQIINIQIERDLSEEETEYLKGLSEEGEQDIIVRHKLEIRKMFEEEDIFEEHIKNLDIRFEEE